MGRRRKAWLPNGTGKRVDRGKELPGWYVYWSEFTRASKRIIRSKCFSSQQNAKTFLRRHNARQELGDLGQVLSITIEEALEEFIGLKSAVRSASTVRQYRKAVASIAAHSKAHDVGDVVTGHIDQLLAKLREQRSEATAAKYWRVLHGFFSWCRRRNYCGSNPCDGVTDRPRSGIVRTKPRISAEQFRLLIDALDTEQRRLGVLIAATTGLDRRVIQGLTWGHVDVAAGQILARRRKTGRDVVVPVHRDILVRLAALHAESAPSRVLLNGLSHQGDDRDWWRRACKSAGIAQLRFVDLRTYAANWLRESLGDFDVQKILGHSTPLVTAKHYHQGRADAPELISRRALPGSPARPSAEKAAAAEPACPPQSSPSSESPREPDASAS